jgi:major membrane immunogen (membrane-anchored lipoprotein)
MEKSLFTALLQLIFFKQSLKLKNALIIIFLVTFFFCCSSFNQNQHSVNEKIKKKSIETKRVLTPSDVFSLLPYLIESSPVDTLRKNFTLLTDVASVPANAKNCKDGFYTADSPYNYYGYKYVVSLEIKNGNIFSVVYDEVSKDGVGKKNDLKYNEEMKKSGSTPSVAYPIYEKRLIETQDINKIDAVSGATYSLYRFKYVVVKALTQAEKNN